VRKIAASQDGANISQGSAATR